MTAVGNKNAFQKATSRPLQWPPLDVDTRGSASTGAASRESGYPPPTPHEQNDWLTPLKKLSSLAVGTPYIRNTTAREGLRTLWVDHDDRTDVHIVPRYSVNDTAQWGSCWTVFHHIHPQRICKSVIKMCTRMHSKRMSTARLWKHYFAATTVAGGKNLCERHKDLRVCSL